MSWALRFYYLPLLYSNNKACKKKLTRSKFTRKAKYEYNFKKVRDNRTRAELTENTTINARRLNTKTKHIECKELLTLIYARIFRGVDKFIMGICNTKHKKKKRKIHVSFNIKII